jgi:hypothetical protein
MVGSSFEMNQSLIGNFLWGELLLLIRSNSLFQHLGTTKRVATLAWMIVVVFLYYKDYYCKKKWTKSSSKQIVVSVSQLDSEGVKIPSPKIYLQDHEFEIKNI